MLIILRNYKMIFGKNKVEFILKTGEFKFIYYLQNNDFSISYLSFDKQLKLCYQRNKDE